MVQKYIDRWCCTVYKWCKLINGAQHLYQIQVRKRKPVRSPKLLWELDLKVEIDSSEWDKSFVNSSKATNVVRDFQYRVINRVLTTKICTNLPTVFVLQ